MTTKKQLPMDSDLAGVDKALKRAAKSAHTLARKTKTPCYVVKDGKIVDIASKMPRASAKKQAIRD
ncbi:hypothetical protein [Geobacter argillaceus]|uniref:Uncharacterized protein n=1 Tax=Geobacter argillaceus TaxID=345631 RepID=A0A562VM63_9BACT|nr:hypothetical protein [Geobacter argillaceus]TWJ19046.1 hypothetical protein JN12_02266 [Geobacter argillaceus]